MTYPIIEKKLWRLTVFFLFLAVTSVVFGQYSGEPVQKDRLIQVLRSKSFQTSDIIKIIAESGVDFKLTPMLESELVAAGARPPVIDAVRNNYRFIKPPTAPVKSDKIASFTGTPLDKEMILTLLKNNTQDSIIKKQVKQSGVNFRMNANIANEIKMAGGSLDLIKLMYAGFNPNTKAGGSGNISVTDNPSANSYNDLIQRAINSFDVQKDLFATQNSLMQAVKLSPNNPRAYQLLGFLNFYGYKNFAEAEKNWKLAISYGGSAVLRVIHDHDGVFLTTCQGSLYIAQNTVRFESDDNIHTFETSDQNIKEIKVNGIFKRLVQFRLGSFKIALRKDSGLDEKNFSFAPMSGSTDESKMIIRLIGKK